MMRKSSGLKQQPSRELATYRRIKDWGEVGGPGQKGEKDWSQHYAYLGYVDTYIRTDAARGIHLLAPSKNNWGAESFSD